MNEDPWWAYAGEEAWTSADGSAVRVLSSSRQAVTIEIVTPGGTARALWDPQVETLSLLGDKKLEQNTFNLVREYISTHAEPDQLHAITHHVLDQLADTLSRDDSLSLKVVRQQLMKTHGLEREQANRVVQRLHPRFAALRGDYLTLEPLGLLRSKRSDDATTILTRALTSMRAAFDENPDVSSISVEAAFGVLDEERKRFTLRVLHLFKLASNISTDGKGTWHVPQDIEELWAENVTNMEGFLRFATQERRVPRPWPGALLRNDWKDNRVEQVVASQAAPTLPNQATTSVTETPVVSTPTTAMVGEWRVIRPLRRGGQGDVSLVERTGSKGHALGVLKRLPEAFAEDAKRVARLKHEIETVKELKHPFIAELLDSNFSDLWFVTRHAVYSSLADHLAWFKGDVFRTLRTARDVALALQVAHENGVIHRDVKPGNILLYDPNHCALTDFGIAHDNDQTEVTATPERVGANWFRPPEAEHGRHEPTPAFDVYMLGKVIYVALSGGERFSRERFQEGAANLVTKLARPELASINRLLAKMIVEEPHGRLQSMAEVIAAIDSTFARVLGGGSATYAEEQRLVFMFGEQGGNRYSGDHPGLRMIPIWLPRTRRLTVDLRIHPGTKDAQYAVELWDNNSKLFDSGRLAEGRTEHELPPGVGGRWASLRVRADNGWGTANISNLVVHASVGGDEG